MRFAKQAENTFGFWVTSGFWLATGIFLGAGSILVVPPFLCAIVGTIWLIQEHLCEIEQSALASRMLEESRSLRATERSIFLRMLEAAHQKDTGQKDVA